MSEAEKFGAQGGRARAANLTKQELSEIGRAGALARWAKEVDGSLPLATYGNPDSPLRIGEIDIPAYVLADGRRVLTQRGLQTGVGFSRSGGKGGARRMVAFLASLEAKGLDTKGLVARADLPIDFRTRWGMADGYEATILPDICAVVIEADHLGLLLPRQRHIARQCAVLQHGFATVGIIALVDEATGYQEARAKDALAKILEKFVAKELRPWVRTFPQSFFEQMCKLKGIPFPKDMKLPPYFGHIINDVIYSRMAPGLLDELQAKNPVVGKGRKHKNFQWLTEDIGNPKLLHHIGSVTGLAYGFEKGDWAKFRVKLNRAIPVQVPLPLFAQPKEETTSSERGVPQIGA